VASEPRQAFAVWITGLPASGKSTLTRELKRRLAARGVNAAVLESDALRAMFGDRYDEQSRDVFYRLMAYAGALLVRQGIPVIFDATANRRSYRGEARRQIPRFVEVYVECPLAVCEARDPKAIYRQARAAGHNDVPGLQAPYEPPEAADVLVRGDVDAPDQAADRVITKLVELGLIDWR